MNNEYKITLNKILLHLKTILIHKYYVFVLCCKYGIIWRGIKHDLSKFSPSEFIPNIRYVRKGISPIDVQKQEIGYAPAWLHHKGMNSHHYEYWIDKLDNGGYITRMPFNDILECMCDMIAANRAYNGRSKDEYNKLYDYWSRKKAVTCMHPDNVEFLEYIFHELYINKSMFDNKVDLIRVYNLIIQKNKRDMQMKISDTVEINKKINN